MVYMGSIALSPLHLATGLVSLTAILSLLRLTVVLLVLFLVIPGFFTGHDQSFWTSPGHLPDW